MPLASVLRLAGRRLIKTPGTCTLAILMLAVGSGAHVAVFSLIYTLFLEPLALDDADRLVGVYQSRKGTGYFPLSFPDYLDHSHESTVFDELAAHYDSAPLSYRIGAEIEQINGAVVSASYFSVLGVEPARGRFFLPEEDETPNTHPVTVVSNGFWHARLGAREDVVGLTLHLNRTAFTVVGVTPASFRGLFHGTPPAVWMPTMMGRVGYRWCDLFDRDCTWLELIGRLEPGRTIVDVKTEMDVLATRVNAAYRADDEEPPGLSVAPVLKVHPQNRPYLRRLTGLLFLSVTLLLLVVAANLSSILLARALHRRRETAMLLAMGAGRMRIFFEMVSETLLVSMAGGALGLLFAVWARRLVVVLYPGGAHLDLDLKPAVLVYAAVLAVLNCLLVAVMPAVQSARTALVPALLGEATAEASRGPTPLGTLVVVQVALSFVLLVSSALLARSLWSLNDTQALDPSTIATLRLRPRLLGYEPAQAQAFTRAVLRGISRIPGVESTSFGTLLPPAPGERVEVGRPGDPSERTAARPAWLKTIAPRFFETLGLSVLRGRDFGELDSAGSAPVAIVNQALAASLWPEEQAVGQRLELDGNTFEVVGLVQDDQYIKLTETYARQVYVPYWQDPTLIDARLVVRFREDSAVVLPTLARMVEALDPSVPVTELMTMRDRLAQVAAPTRLANRVVGFSSIVALLLSAAGLFGVLTLVVARRTREIGIRMAIGANRRDTVNLVLRGAMRQVGIALGVGLAATLLFAPRLGGDLHGTSPRDPLSFAVAFGVLVAVSGLACWLPARRAARVDPLVALRHD